MRRRVELRIHREDHKIDPLGQIFLDAADRTEVLRILRGYVGIHATLREVELDDDVLRVAVDVRDHSQESQNLVDLGRQMARRGYPKGAAGQLEEALRLSPLNPEALKSLGRLHYRHRRREEARAYLTRAREVAPDDLEVLRLLAEIALHENRRLAARAYLEQVLRVNAADRRARTAMARLQPAEANAEATSKPPDAATPPDEVEPQG